MPYSPYSQYIRTAGMGPQPFTPYNQSNLPPLSMTGSLQSQPAQVGDLASTVGGQAPMGGGATRYAPHDPNAWESSWRQFMQLASGNMLNQRLDGIRKNASRTGLSNSGLLTSMENPAWMEYNQNILGGEAEIGKAAKDYELEYQRMRLMREMNQQRPDWLNLAANALFSVPSWITAIGGP